MTDKQIIRKAQELISDAEMVVAIEKQILTLMAQAEKLTGKHEWVNYITRDVGGLLVREGYAAKVNRAYDVLKYRNARLREIDRTRQ